ncbi:hypothetical protein ScPMuIL_012109 [Solemya velum]
MDPKSDAESVLSTGDSVPLTFDGFIDNWTARTWSITALASSLSGKFNCKMAPKSSDLLMETDCVYEEVTVQEFCEWCEGSAQPPSPLLKYDKSKFSAYVDYKYMKDMFVDKPDMLQAVKWDVFGLDGRNGYDSTIWIGSESASTPLHYDTYGFNLVAQICGRKRWVLFPPKDTQNLYPTRIPYEESSVFSEVNLKCPDTIKHKRVKNCHFHVVTLEPGQVLYVPRHWWHFVECLEDSVSINTWVEMPEDNVSRLHEAVTRTLFTALLPALSGGATSQEKFVNPTEELHSAAVNLTYLQQSLQSLRDYRDINTQPPNNFTSFARTFRGIPIVKKQEKFKDKLGGYPSPVKDTETRPETKKRKTDENLQYHISEVEKRMLSMAPDELCTQKCADTDNVCGESCEQDSSVATTVSLVEGVDFNSFLESELGGSPPSATKKMGLVSEWTETEIKMADIVQCVLHPVLIGETSKMITDKFVDSINISQK